MSDITDSRGPVDLTSVKWRSGRLPDAVVEPLAVPKLDLDVTSTGLRRCGVLARPDVGHPRAGRPSAGPARPPLQGSAARRFLGQRETCGCRRASTAPTPCVQPVGKPTYLPRVLDGGQLVDLQYVLRTSRTPLAALRDVRLGRRQTRRRTRLARLASAGLKIDGTESVAARRHQLDREGTALALGIFLVAALAAVVLAGGALLTTTTAAARTPLLRARLAARPRCAATGSLSLRVAVSCSP